MHLPDEARADIGVEFPKMHSSQWSEHQSSELITFASILFTNANLFEAGHEPNIKDLTGNSYGKDQFIFMSMFYDRMSNFQAHLAQAGNLRQNKVPVTG